MQLQRLMYGGWQLFFNKCYLQIDGNNIREKKQHVGSSGLSFKSRYTRSKCSYNNSKYRLKTTLSKYTWKLIDRNQDFNINWDILARK